MYISRCCCAGSVFHHPRSIEQILKPPKVKQLEAEDLLAELLFGEGITTAVVGVDTSITVNNSTVTTGRIHLLHMLIQIGCRHKEEHTIKGLHCRQELNVITISHRRHHHLVTMAILEVHDTAITAALMAAIRYHQIMGIRQDIQPHPMVTTVHLEWKGATDTRKTIVIIVREVADRTDMAILIGSAHRR